LRNAPEAQGHPPVDALLDVGKDGRQVEYAVEAKRTVTPATLGAVVTLLRHIADATGHAALLITGYVTPLVADRLRGLKQQFADAAGNAYLEGPVSSSSSPVANPPRHKGARVPR
jgi:hypothetical protein